LNSTERDNAKLRRQAIVPICILAAMAALSWWRGRPVLTAFFCVMVTLFLMGLAVPALLEVLHGAAQSLAKGLSAALLGMVYYLLITPIGLALRLVGKDPLDRKIEPERESYWLAKEEPEDIRRSFERQF
jgi:hypothetical protein